MSETATTKRARILGRVAEEEWQQLKAAAAQSGQTFTKWALTAMRKEMKRQQRSKGDK